MKKLQANRRGGRLTYVDYEKRYNWLVEFFQENEGRAPSYDEVSEGWGVSKTSVAATLKRFEMKGWITLARNDNGHVIPGSMRLKKGVVDG